MKIGYEPAPRTINQRIWHRYHVVIGLLDMVDHRGRPDTRELVVNETVMRRRVSHSTPFYGTFETWEYRWPA